MIVVRVLDNQMLFTLNFCGYNSSFAFVHPSSCTTPIHLASRNLVLRERIVADLQLARPSKACDEFDVCEGSVK